MTARYDIRVGVGPADGPVSRLYLSHTALDALEQAQAELDAHLPTGSDGRCLTCRQEIPCRARERASLAFHRYGALPRRRPGLARVRPVGSPPRCDSLGSW
jgi:hypothetical protein